MPKLTSIASSAVMALKMFMTLFSFYVGGVAAGGLHGSFSSNSPIRELARGAFLASWPVTNVPVWIWSAQYSNAWITMTKRFRTWKYCHNGCTNWKSKISCTWTKSFKVPFLQELEDIREESLMMSNKADAEDCGKRLLCEIARYCETYYPLS